MKNLGILALAAIAALVLGFGARLGTPEANASATDIQLIGCELIAAGIDGDLTDATVAGDFAVCGNVDPTPAELVNLDATYGDDDGTLEPSDLEDRDALDDNQISEDCLAAGGSQCTLLAFVYVDDEAAVTLDPPAGLVTLEAGTIDAVCNTEADDADCADVTPNDGDGVVVFHVSNDTAGDDDVLTVEADQEGDTVTADVNIQGTPDEVDLVVLKDVLQQETDSASFNDCTDDTDVTDSSPLSDESQTIAIATVTDNDGDELTRVSVDLASGDADILEIATGTPGEATGNTGQTVDGDTAGIAQFAVLCADEDTGEVDVTATITIGTTEEESTVTITVVGEPDAIALTASPATIACDGTQTSTVSATVTDSEGNNVADGVNVNFAVVALGTANPINVATVDGAASSTITPLSNASAGVTVIVTAGDAQSSIRVDCSIPIPTQPSPVASPTRPGGQIGGPDTGNGGYLGQDSNSGFPMWALAALALGSLALVAGGMATRRVSK